MAQVDVSITPAGNIVGQGITNSDYAVNVAGGNLDSILKSFGGIEGGIEGGSEAETFKNKTLSVLSKTKDAGEKMNGKLEEELMEIAKYANDLQQLSSLGQSALESIEFVEAREALKKVISEISKTAQSIREKTAEEISVPKTRLEDFLTRNNSFQQAINKLGVNINKSSLAGMASMTFTDVNSIKKISEEVKNALSTVGLSGKDYVSKNMSELEKVLEKNLTKSDVSKPEMKKFIMAWKVLANNQGIASKLDTKLGGATMGNNLNERLLKSREELKTMINKFINAFGSNINNIVRDIEKLSSLLGKSIPYSDETSEFLGAFVGLSEFLNATSPRLYQHLLELNTDQVDSKEIKTRFISSLKYIATQASDMGSDKVVKSLSSECYSTIETINKHSDIIKSFRDDVKKQGGSDEAMNELYSVDSSRIEISALLNPLENLKIAISKINFFRNISIFRSNMTQTNKELAVYSKDYEKSVGKAIGEAISKIKTEYTEVVNQISDNKTGMGLEIDMYNESRPKEEKISKEKLKQIYKWQCDARTGLYKTVEAVDLYLLHFTNAVTKNPDAVSDLHKMLAATNIIAKWYDEKAGDNLIRTFESFRPGISDTELDSANFASDYALNQEMYADLTKKIGGERANRIYERCRRAVEGVVVLKNIISYFICLGEKYGDFKSEKSIYMAPSNIYKNLVNYLWVSALDVNTTGTEVLTDNNETKRLLTYEDTKVKIAPITNIDPEVMGINFNRHAIDKLRIMKCHNELLRLKDFTASMGKEDIKRIKQYVTSVFARLSKTKYIFHMFTFGVYDLSQMDTEMIKEFIEFVRIQSTSTAIPVSRRARITFNVDGVDFVLSSSTFDIDALVAAIDAVPSPLRDDRIAIIGEFVNNNGTVLENDESHRKYFIPLSKFSALDDDLVVSGFSGLNGLTDIVRSEDGQVTNYRGNDVSNNNYGNLTNPGFLSGFLSGLTSGNTAVSYASYAARTVAALHYCVMGMLNQYKSDNSSSVFAIDDTYFILTLKAIAGKIMAVTGVNSLFKNPKSYNNTLMKNQTRLIMGGASDVDVLDDAVELYVRLPLLVEFYRAIFDNGNKEYKQESVSGSMDEEQISYVPEVGNIWTGLIQNIFDKSKHIESGVYTPENMKTIVSEVNKIYKHYKGTVSADRLTRHVMTELVAEVNRRYGVIKRQELLQYYRVMNSTKRNKIEIGESNYSNNDLDILNEGMEFESKSPSDEFIKFQKSISDPSVDAETKINRLTDYKILKEFRERIQSMLNIEESRLHAGDDSKNDFLSMVDRIRLLKKSVSTKATRAEKYDSIIRAIEESESMNQSSNDIFNCFHEFVIVPLRMVHHLHRCVDQFLLQMFVVANTTMVDGAAAIYPKIVGSPILRTKVKVNGIDIELRDAIANIAASRSDEVKVGNALKINTQVSTLVGSTIRDSTGTLDGSNGITQIVLLNIISQFCSNAGDLVKSKVSTTNRVTIDLSELQTTCEYLLANVKYMVDKFTNLVPGKLIDSVLKIENEGSVFWLEDKLINRIFNKYNKNESERDILSVDTLNMIMPLVSEALFNTEIDASRIITQFAIAKDGMNALSMVPVSATLPIIRDAFMEYKQTARSFVSADGRPTYISPLLFNPVNGATLTNLQPGSGFVQEFNIIISQYLNDMYDSQSKKIYGKCFNNFASSALVDALNGQSYPDFANIQSTRENDLRQSNIYDASRSHRILSATLAYVMKVMSNRTNPNTGAKVHEAASLQEVSPHVLEKYRSLIPMYLRVFNTFINRCRFYRKTLGKIKLADGAVSINPVSVPSEASITEVRENSEDGFVQFATPIDSIDGTSSSESRDYIMLYLDDIVNSMSSLIEDAHAVQTELMESDDTVSLYFDVKKDFTKNYFKTSKELPFAPLSILAMGFRKDGANPYPNARDSTDNKFTYGLRSLLADNFNLTTKRVPYLKKLINDFNGYTPKVNNIKEDKFNETLKYVGRAFNFFYDLRFFNGKILSRYDVIEGMRTPIDSSIRTYQETVSKNSSLTLIESVNVIDSGNKIAEHVKETAVDAADSETMSIDGSNPRTRVIMVNIVDLNIMPINVHSLMREIPLANIYNYAMTFETTIDSLNIPEVLKTLLKKPYSPLNIRFRPDNKMYIRVEDSEIDIDTLVGSDTSLRFIGDTLFKKVIKYDNMSPVTNVQEKYDASVLSMRERANSKLFHNLTFATLLQYAIKNKVNNELNFINTRIVSNTAAVSDTITNATTDMGKVTDNLFEL